jgi:DNA-directed RNA polymerase specialized sigma24 family protein
MKGSIQELFDTLLPQLRSIAKNLTGNRELQKDLVQEMCLYVCEQWQEVPDQPADWYTQKCQDHALDRPKVFADESKLAKWFMEEPQYKHVATDREDDTGPTFCPECSEKLTSITEKVAMCLKCSTVVE